MNVALAEVEIVRVGAAVMAERVVLVVKLKFPDDLGGDQTLYGYAVMRSDMLYRSADDAMSAAHREVSNVLAAKDMLRSCGLTE